jgi:serine/threonine-protein kinase
MEPVPTPRVFSNRYELTHLIARGGMAQVYRARDRLLDRPVALKVLFPELSVDRAFVERFRREAQAAANLSHPNIVPVFDWGEDTGTYFIVMEFIDGRPLSQVLRSSGPLAPVRTADIGAHVAAALSYAHRHGVIHRDVKPGNVLITDDGQVKVTDFGIARAVNTEESLTQTGAVMGTATYFSPEQAEGIGVDARSDIYSLGVVLFEMSTGRPPFLGDTPVAVASKHVRDVPPTPRELNPAIPVALESVIMKAMAKLPDNRYDTADDLRSDLMRFAEGQPVLADSVLATAALGASTVAMGADSSTQALLLPPGAVVVPEESAEVAEARRRRRRLILILVGMLVALAVVVFFLGKSLGYWGTSLTVPNVVGEKVATATATLEQKGLVVGPNRTVTGSQPVGTVVSTDPSPGTSVKSGSTITLTVSVGKAATYTTVPNTTGLSLTDAEAELSSANLVAKVHLVPSDQPESTVISSDPVDGARVVVGSTVTLTVSQPAATVSVPNVVGQTQAQAGQQLGAVSLTVGSSSTTCSNSIGNGLVVSTSPGAGTPVAKNSAVNLVVSSGSCQVVVSNVVGQTQSAATSTLLGQGLVVNAQPTTDCSPTQNGSVLNQNPSGGTTVANGSQVTITVCSASPPTSSSTSTSTSTTSTSTTTTSTTT